MKGWNSIFEMARVLWMVDGWKWIPTVQEVFCSLVQIELEYEMSSCRISLDGPLDGTLWKCFRHDLQLFKGDLMDFWGPDDGKSSWSSCIKRSSIIVYSYQVTFSEVPKTRGMRTLSNCPECLQCKWTITLSERFSSAIQFGRYICSVQNCVWNWEVSWEKLSIKSRDEEPIWGPETSCFDGSTVDGEQRLSLWAHYKRE